MYKLMFNESFVQFSVIFTKRQIKVFLCLVSNPNKLM